MRLLFAALALSTSFACATVRAPENAVADEFAVQQRENAIARAELAREAFVSDARRTLQMLDARVRESGDGALITQKNELSQQLMAASTQTGEPLADFEQNIRAGLFELDRRCAMVESGHLASN